MIERREEFQAALEEYDDIIMEYPQIRKLVVPLEEDFKG